MTHPVESKWDSSASSFKSFVINAGLVRPAAAGTLPDLADWGLAGLRSENLAQLR